MDRKRLFTSTGLDSVPKTRPKGIAESVLTMTKILEDDRAYYNSTPKIRPPFVKNKDGKNNQDFKAMVYDHGKNTGQEITVEARDWNEGHGGLIYYTAAIAGVDYILTRSSGGKGGIQCKKWQGHERGEGHNVVARSVLKKKDIEESSHKYHGEAVLPGAVPNTEQNQGPRNTLARGLESSFTTQPTPHPFRHGLTSEADRFQPAIRGQTAGAKGTGRVRSSATTGPTDLRMPVSPWQPDQSTSGKLSPLRTNAEVTTTLPNIDRLNSKHDTTNRRMADRQAQIQDLEDENLRLQDMLRLNVRSDSLLSFSALIVE
ncbi:MAG: hypothetical protein Q9222_001771 [Ikaeria aurantiellina]